MLRLPREGRLSAKCNPSHCMRHGPPTEYREFLIQWLFLWHRLLVHIFTVLSRRCLSVSPQLSRRMSDQCCPYETPPSTPASIMAPTLRLLLLPLYLAHHFLPQSHHRQAWLLLRSLCLDSTCPISRHSNHHRNPQKAVIRLTRQLLGRCMALRAKKSSWLLGNDDSEWGDPEIMGTQIRNQSVFNLFTSQYRTTVAISTHEMPTINPQLTSTRLLAPVSRFGVRRGNTLLKRVTMNQLMSQPMRTKISCAIISIFLMSFLQPLGSSRIRARLKRCLRLMHTSLSSSENAYEYMFALLKGFPDFGSYVPLRTITTNELTLKSRRLIFIGDIHGMKSSFEQVHCVT
ncbi:hypothetical protein K439DRAFT_258138 [Ramaria rubella]|nr:hypothetical protein K439DRAFT_258138 [Ramaria rubella]